MPSATAIAPIRPSGQVVLMSDGNALDDTVDDLLASAFSVSRYDLSQAEALQTLGDKPVVFCVAGLEASQLSAVRRVIAGLSNRPIFIFPVADKKSIDRVNHLGAQAYFTAPLDDFAVLSAVRQVANAGVERSWSRLEPAEEKALVASRQGFDDCFAAAARGEPLPVEEVYSACETIQESMGASNVDRWLGALQEHHNNTYRHCMFVCGTIAFFFHGRGLRGDELKELTMGGFLHDAGKANIPLAILDKPAKLDDDEFKIMRTHPSHSREILMRENGLSDAIITMAVHHHEKLDGTGYPDGLKGAQMSDIVRLTAIADVYSALIEKRAYKPAMSNEKAFEIMTGFDPGHLDQVLVSAFREFVMDHVKNEAA
jgi:HD-GYP domain-containing protein (c-di-GMP phosphodiesterase class II)